MGDHGSDGPRPTVLAAGTVGGAGTTVALLAALDALVSDGGPLVVIAPRPLAAAVERAAPMADVVRVGRGRAILGELVGRDRAQVYIGFADRLPLVGRGGTEQVLVVQNPHLYETTEQSDRFSVRCRLAVLRWWARRSIATADRIVCSSAASAAAVAAASGIDRSAIEVRPIPVALPDVAKPDHRERIDQVLLVGDVYGYKRWDVAVDAVAIFARQQQRPVTVVHIGTVRDADAAALFDAAISAAATSNVVVKRLGVTPHDDVLEAMRDADVVLLTSTAETQGLPLAEALAAGVPVVCRSLGVFSEQGGAAAVLVDGGAIEFAAALADIDDRDEHVRRAALGRVSMEATLAGPPGWRLLD